MSALDLIKARESVREYNDKPIEKEIFNQLVEAARLAPTARGVQPWDFIVIQDKKNLEKIAAMAPNAIFIKSAQAAIAVVSKDTKYYLEDCCAATENILLMAADLGLGACWIAGDKKDYAGAILEMLNCPEGSMLVSIISLGYPAKKQISHKKRPLEDVIHWETFYRIDKT